MKFTAESWQDVLWLAKQWKQNTVSWDEYYNCAVTWAQHNPEAAQRVIATIIADEEILKNVIPGS